MHTPPRLVTAGPPSVFVASSSEGAAYARAVQGHLQADGFAEVQVWTDDVFTLNRAYFDDLLDNAGYFDYAVAVLTPDDQRTVRDTTEPTARDNVVFEYGLFLGRLGPQRAFALKEASVRTFSDFAGIDTALFTASGDPDAAVREACGRLKALIERNEARYDITFLPSTALALGYYHNFLGRLIDSLLGGEPLRVTTGEGSDAEVAYDGRQVRLTILLPRRLRDLDERPLRAKTRRMQEVTLATPFRTYPFYVEGALGSDTLDLFDIPTTLRASNFAIERAFRPDFFAADPARRARIERREISNFEKTLRHELDDDLEDLVVRFALLGDERG